MIHRPALHAPGSHGGHVHDVRPVGPAHRPSAGRLAAWCVGACVLPPLAIGPLVAGFLPATFSLAAVLALLSLPTYAVFWLAGRALVGRQETAEDARQAWLALRWDLIGGAALLNLTFVDYFSAGAGLWAMPVEFAVIALTDVVVFMIGAGLTEFVRGQVLGRSG